MQLATSHKILTSGGALLDDTVEDVLQGVVTDDHDNQILVRVDIEVVPAIGRNLYSVTISAKKSIVASFDFENPRLEGINVTVPLRRESSDLYSFVLDLSADGYGAKELAMNAITNAQVWHRHLGHLHAPSPGAASLAEPVPGAAGRPSSGEASPPSGGGASPEMEKVFQVPIRTIAKRGTAMRNNRIPQLNIVTRRAAAEPTGAVTRYRRIRSNNNNNTNTGGWSTAVLDPGIWYSTVCEGGCRFMAAWVREEEKASENWQRTKNA